MARNTASEGMGILTSGCSALATVYATTPGANTNIYAAVKVSESASAIRITVSLATSSVFDLRITDGSTAYTLHLNEGVALTASCLYTFVVAARRYSSQTGTTELTYSNRVATDGVVQLLFVEEVTGPVV